MTYSAVNWNELNESYIIDFWNANIRQFWIDTEFKPSDDKIIWTSLTEEEREVYKRVLGGLTLLDTQQGTVGMPKIAEKVDNLHKKAILSFMGMMENIHAKSYSTIFSTLASTEEINNIFKWVEENKYLQKKADTINEYYTNIKNERDLYMAMVASVFLETFLFYSGFFYPLFLAGQGKMTASGEIINLIIRDESIHGVFVGLLAQDLFKGFSKQRQKKVQEEAIDLLKELYSNEVLYTDEVYSPLGLQEEVKKFIRYNANKAMMNLGLEPYFPEEDINAIVLNGLKTDTKTHDFFSVKGNGYVKAINVEPLTDEDFVFDFE